VGFVRRRDRKHQDEKRRSETPEIDIAALHCETFMDYEKYRGSACAGFITVAHVIATRRSVVWLQFPKLNDAFRIAHLRPLTLQPLKTVWQ
jgi:hypothetical protein